MAKTSILADFYLFMTPWGSSIIEFYFLIPVKYDSNNRNQYFQDIWFRTSVNMGDKSRKFQFSFIFLYNSYIKQAILGGGCRGGQIIIFWANIWNMSFLGNLCTEEKKMVEILEKRWKMKHPNVHKEKHRRVAPLLIPSTSHLIRI